MMSRSIRVGGSCFHVACLVVLALLGVANGARAQQVEVTLQIQRVHGCCDTVDSSEAFFKYKIPAAGISERSGHFTEMSDGEWNDIDETRTFLLDASLGTVVLEIEQHDDDSGLNFGDNEIDMTQGAAIRSSCRSSS